MGFISSQILLLAMMSGSCYGGFAPKRQERERLTECLLSRKSEYTCFAKEDAVSRQKLAEPRRRKHCSTKDSGDVSARNSLLDSANDYICALNDYKNIIERRAAKHKRIDVVNAISAAGSCARFYRSVRRTWKKKLSSEGDVIRVTPPEWEYRNGSTTTVGFVAGVIANSYPTGSLLGVDLIISRSHAEDVEVSGKYILRVSIKLQNGERLVVHDTVQGTCVSSGNRYFVAGLESVGIKNVSQWLTNENNTIEFLIDIITQEQIIRGSTKWTEYIGTEFDIGQRVSGIVLHFSSLPTPVLPLPLGLFDSRRGRVDAVRKKRSLQLTDDGPCRLVQYHVNYRNNPKIVRPDEFNVGECVGSCEQALFLSTESQLQFNATNHALSMLWESQKVLNPPNPEPTVCCAPISFRKMYFVTMDKRGLMMSTYVENMVAEYCGCR